MMTKKLAIVIPTYKESANILKLVNEIAEIVTSTHIIIVDDSPDKKTKVIIEKLDNKNISIINRYTKLGRGSAVLEGMREHLKLDFEFLLEMDADFSHLPNEINSMLSMIKNENADLVIASRYLRNSKIVNWPLSRRIFSRLANKLCRKVVKLNIHDYTNGYRIYSKRAVTLTLNKCGKIGDGFIILSEIIAQLSSSDYKIIEKETIFINRLRGESSLSIKEVIGAAVGLYKIKKIINAI